MDAMKASQASIVAVVAFAAALASVVRLIVGLSFQVVDGRLHGVR
jgi:nitrate/nitrite transporter NarK